MIRYAFLSIVKTLSGDKISNVKTAAADVTAEPPMHSIIHIVSLLTVTVL